MQTPTLKIKKTIINIYHFKSFYERSTSKNSIQYYHNTQTNIHSFEMNNVIMDSMKMKWIFQTLFFVCVSNKLLIVTFSYKSWLQFYNVYVFQQSIPSYNQGDITFTDLPFWNLVSSFVTRGKGGCIGILTMEWDLTHWHWYSVYLETFKKYTSQLFTIAIK